MEESLSPYPADTRRKALYEMSSWKDVDRSLVLHVGLALLAEPDDMARAQAARTLGTWGTPDALPYLSVALVGAIDGVAFTDTVAELNELGIAMPEKLDRSKFVRRGAAWGLANVTGDNAVRSLVHAVQFDIEPDVRMQCARSLGQHRHVDAARGLILALADPDLGVRTLAADSLEHMTGRDLGQDPEAWALYFTETDMPLAHYGSDVKIDRSQTSWIDLSEDRKAKIREIFSDLFPLERKEGPFD
jgi:HEAT repeat protein